MPEIETPIEGVVETPLPDPAAELAALKLEYETVKTQAAEQTRAAKYWFDESAKHTPAPKAAPVVAADPDEDDILDILTSKGAKGFDDLMAKRGYIKREDMDKTISAKTAQLTKEAELVKRYPDLNDNKSEFFKAVANEYGDLKNKGVSEPVAIEMAAERIELRFLREGKLKTPKEQAAETATAKETARQARIKAQAGDRGGHATEQEGDSDELTPEQKQVAIRMLAGDGVTNEQAIEAYAKRAKSGVRVRGGLR